VALVYYFWYSMPTTAPLRKIKKSFSISAASDSFIRKMQKQRKVRSESETLDALLSELMDLQEKQTIEAAYANYYESLSDEEIADQRSWGGFAEDNFAETES
jgi:hypothetical protein